MQNPKLYVTTFPNFIEIQKTSFCWFLSNGLSEELSKLLFLFDSANNKKIYSSNSIYKLRKPEYNEFEAKQKGITYSVKIYVNIRSNVDLSLRFQRQYFAIGVLPLMTNTATFIINGYERVIINQIVRSPGIYFQKIRNRIQNNYRAILISKEGLWLSFELKSALLNTNSEIFISSNKLHKMSAIDLLNHLSLDLNTYDANSFEIDRTYLKFLKEGFFTIGEIGRLKLNKRLNLHVHSQIDTITSVDIIAICNHLLQINDEKNVEDDIDHLKNKKVRAVGELLKNQFFIAFERFKSIAQKQLLHYSDLILSKFKPLEKSVTITIDQFFGSSQLSQFLDQTNPIAALTHKRRISSLGLGGLNSERVNVALRDIHPSHYGRICPIETPEGQNCGLISSLAIYAKVNAFGLIETPFWRVKNGQIFKTGVPFYLNASIEDNFRIASADTTITKENLILDKIVTVRYKQEFITVPFTDVDFITISTVQMISPAAGLIPFFEHDDANRTVMGSNMQRQSVPLLISQKPIIGTGLEHQIAGDSSLTAIRDGIVTYVSSKIIVVARGNNKKTIYTLEKYLKSNQSTCINYNPIVWAGQKVKSGQIIADGPSTNDGELSLGTNVTVAYMPWEGYNYEDAILINERLIYEDLFTSIHIEKYQIEIYNTNEGEEEVTANIPGVSLIATEHLDVNGVIKIGTFVRSNDILVGKVTLKNLNEEPFSHRLIRKAFENIKSPIANLSTIISNVKDNSLRLPYNADGRVVNIQTLLPKNTNKMRCDTIKTIIVSVAQIRKIQIGDKIAGRHGNKGIISKILARQDMPYLPDGTPIDIILNPLGVPSRMNVGQLYECLLGFAASKLQKRFKVLPFDEMHGLNASRILINIKLREASLKKNEGWIFNPYSPGKIVLTDGRNNQPFKNPITVGKNYMLKLIHLVEDKIHARCTGPYSLITQQPLGGKSNQGGQRFGEMEVWAVEAYGAAYTLIELLTIKSDDINGRTNLFSSIINGAPFPTPGIPESFRFLITELNALGLNTNLYSTNH